MVVVLVLLSISSSWFSVSVDRLIIMYSENVWLCWVGFGLVLS